MKEKECIPLLERRVRLFEAAKPTESELQECNAEVNSLCGVILSLENTFWTESSPELHLDFFLWGTKCFSPKECLP